MKINLKTLKQDCYEIEVEDANLTIMELKDLIEINFGIDKTKLKLIFNSLVLDDLNSLNYYSIFDNYTLIMANVKILSEEIININQIHNEDDLDLYSDQRGSKEENLTDVTNFTNGANNIIDNIIENDKEKIIEADIKAENAVRYIASILKVLSLENPIKGKEFFKNFEEDNPQIMNLIKKNDSEFKRLLYSPKTDEDIEIFKKFYKGQVNESNPDEDNIKILVDYGFSYKKSKEVYYAFDKQIELALNFLLDGN